MVYYRELFKEFKHIMKKINILIIKVALILENFYLKMNMKIIFINLIIFILLITYIMII